MRSLDSSLVDEQRFRREMSNDVKFRARLRRYNVTIDEALKYLIKHNFKCYICRNHLRYSFMDIDHDHDRELFRGIICRNCNVGLGMFNHDYMRMMRATMYILSFLKQHL